MRLKNYEITFGNALNLLFGLFEKLFAYRYFNLWKTLYINFRLFPFRQAVKLPIFVWGGLRIGSLMGKGEIKGNVTSGMILFGLRNREELVGYTKSLFSNQGTIIFNGEAVLFNGFTIRINKDTVFDVGDKVMFSSNVSIYAMECDIKIGDNTRIAYNSLLMSSDMHFSIDTTTREVYKNSAPIILGANNWITGYVRIMKGTVTPEWTIVTSGSFLNKDYTATIAPESIIGGVPAKLIKTGQRRVFSIESEELLRNYFDKSESNVYLVSDDTDLDNFCKR